MSTQQDVPETFSIDPVAPVSDVTTQAYTAFFRDIDSTLNARPVNDSTDPTNTNDDNGTQPTIADFRTMLEQAGQLWGDRRLASMAACGVQGLGDFGSALMRGELPISNPFSTDGTVTRLLSDWTRSSGTTDTARRGSVDQDYTEEGDDCVETCAAVTNNDDAVVTTDNDDPVTTTVQTNCHDNGTEGAQFSSPGGGPLNFAPGGDFGTTVVPRTDSPVRPRARGASPETGSPGGDRAMTQIQRDVFEGRDMPQRTQEQVVTDYARTLVRSGMTEQAAQQLAQQTYDRLARLGANQRQGTPEQQMDRANRAMTSVLDGNNGTWNDQNRRDFVMGAAHRFSNPDRFGNQGGHNSCALTSLGNQLMEGGDPARVMEQMASIANTGQAQVRDNVTGQVRTVRINPDSIRPDAESRVAFSTAAHGDRGNRDLAGHVWDAFAGQLAADLRAEREGLPQGSYVYMAAHADVLGARNGQSRTGEGLFRSTGDGRYQFVTDSPGVGIWDVAHLNRAIGGQEGAVFAHRGLVGDGRPPAGYPADLRITTFDTPEQLHRALTAFQQRTGQSGQIGVNAPFLPGGGRNGHGMHAMRVRANADGTFKLDNNWGATHDLGRVTAAQVNDATNPTQWRTGSRPADGPVPQPGDNPNPGPAPDRNTPFRPGDGQNPNESNADYERRRRAEEEQRQEREREQRERDQRDNPDTRRRDMARAIGDFRYQIALAQYESDVARAARGDSVTPVRPDRADFGVV